MAAYEVQNSYANGHVNGTINSTFNAKVKHPSVQMSEKLDEIEQIWGRRTKATWFSAFLCFLLVTLPPVILTINFATLEYFDGSVLDTLTAFREEGPLRFFIDYSPRPDFNAAVGYLAWLLFQALLYTFLPGPLSTGQMTPAGNLLKYRTNGLNAWLLTHALFLTLGFSPFLDMAIIANNWQGLVVATYVYGFIISAISLVKAHLAPSHPNDRKFSGSIIFDFFAGVELNPRFGHLWDFKLFHNGRPGIIAWTLISLSHTAAQYQKLGYVTNSLILVDLFHFMYVVDFFINEDWYLRTIDMAHDHFGYMLGFGSVAIVPGLYTIQAQYLARYPVDLSTLHALAVLLIGLSGYAIFRAANHQKDVVRQTNGQCDIWGKKAEVIIAPYKTADGQSHESLLLCSGRSPFFSSSAAVLFFSPILFSLGVTVRPVSRNFMLTWNH